MDYIDEFYADKDLSLLKKLTLVIPTYNRNYYLSRCLWYHAHFPFGEIIVADSSPEEKKVVNRETVAKIRETFGTNVRYLEYEPETEKYGGDIYRKWGSAIQNVDTKYSIICVDRGFLIPNTILKELNFLESHQEYDHTVAQWIWMDKNTSHKDRLEFFLAKDYLDNARYEALSPSAQERYLSHLHSKGMTLIFALWRTQPHKRVYQDISTHQILDIRLSNLAIDTLGHLYGNTKYFNNNIDSCRDVIQQNRNGCINKNESSDSRYPTIGQYILEGTFNYFYSPFQCCLHQALVEVIGEKNVNCQDITQLINERKNSLLNGTSKNKDLGSILLRHSQLRNFWGYTPELMKRIIKKLTGYDDKMNYINPIPDDVLLIKTIWRETQHLHKSDTPLKPQR